MSVTLNGEEFNLDDFRGMGHARVLPAGYGRPSEPRFPDRIFGQMLDVIESNVDASGNAATSATAAQGYSTAASGYATTATNAAATAVAAAASTDYPFTTTAGTSTAYTVDFTPDRTVSDGFSMRLNFHTACGSNPTIVVDGGTAYGLVDGSAVDGNGAYKPIAAGRILAGMNLVLLFDSSISKHVVLGLPVLGALSGVYRPFDSVSINHTFGLIDAGRLQLFTGSTDRTWTVPANASVAFEIGTEIEVYNDSTAQLTLTAGTGVTVNGVTAGSITLIPNQGGIFKKVGTNRWIYMGDEKDVWAV